MDENKKNKTKKPPKMEIQLHSACSSIMIIAQVGAASNHIINEDTFSIYRLLQVVWPVICIIDKD